MITVRIAITIATIGRLIKKLEIIYSHVLFTQRRKGCKDRKGARQALLLLRLCVKLLFGSYKRYRRHGHAWSDFQCSFSDDRFTRLEAVFNNPHRAALFPELHGTNADLIV